MSTPNFASNSNTIFAFGANSEDDDELLFVSDIKESVYDELDSNKELYIIDANRYDDNRSYAGNIFAELSTKNHDTYFYIEAELIVRGGYYSGANLDYALNVKSDYSGQTWELDDSYEDDIKDELDYYGTKCDMRHFKPLMKRLEKEAETLRKVIEETYTKYTTPLIRVATFSNGEAIYEKKTLELSDLRG